MIMGILDEGNFTVKQTVFDKDKIKKRVEELGRQITEDYKGKELAMIGVINGALYFFADITREIDMPVLIDTIGFANIPDTTSKTGRVKISKNVDIDIEGKDVLIVEDVIRTGLTTAYLISNLELQNPKSIGICTMLLNPDRLLLNLPVKYTGFEINDSWLLGYGLDRKGIGRNLPEIVSIEHQS